jgi:peptide/nickel transport system permease protein
VTRAFIAVLAGWCLAAAFGTALGEAPQRIDLSLAFAPPSSHAWLGRDELGRSLALRVLAGAALSVPLALVVVTVSALVGTTLGVVAGWMGGAADRLLARVTTVFMALPGSLLAIALAGLLGPGLDNIVYALCMTGWVGFARLTRSQAGSLRGRDHVLAARALGTPLPRILWRHVLPLLAGPLIVEATFAFAGAITAEAGLSFLGLGAQPPTPAWGAMLREAAGFLLVAPHLLLGPACALVSLVLAVQALGERLRHRWLNPQ